jgi:hypothetical protein
MNWAEIIVAAAAIYLVSGVSFAAWFVVAGAGRLDAAARGTGAGFRALIFPGAAALWWLLLWRVLRGRGRPVERSAHRLEAGK